MACPLNTLLVFGFEKIVANKMQTVDNQGEHFKNYYFNHLKINEEGNLSLENYECCKLSLLTSFCKC